jgi:hypothetical protein
MPDGIGDFNDIFVSWPGNDTVGVRSPGASPRGRGASQPGSPSCSQGDPSDQRSPFPCNGDSLRVSSSLRWLDWGEEGWCVLSLMEFT